MSEAEYLRNVIFWAFGSLGALLALLAAILGWVYVSRENRSDVERQRLQNSIDTVTATIFDEGQAVRNMLHEQDKRISRLEDWRTFVRFRSHIANGDGGK